LDNNDGFILCLLITFVWLTVLWSEVRQSIEFFLALFSIPKGESMKLKVYQTADDVTVKVLEASLIRHAWIAVLAAWRLGLGIFVCVAGTRFLVYSPLVEDLVLNAAALVFILSIDECFFDGMAPTRVKTLIKTAAPFQFPKWHSAYHGCGVASVSGLIWVATILGVIMFAILPNERDSRLDALQALCPFPADQHFVGASYISRSPSNWDNRPSHVDEFAVALDKIGIITWGDTRGPIDITKVLNRDREIQEIVKTKLALGEGAVQLAPDDSIVRARYKEQLRGEIGVDAYFHASLPAEATIFNSHPYRHPSNWTFVGCIDIRRADGLFPEPQKDANGQETEYVTKKLAFGALSDLRGFEVTDCSQMADMCIFDNVNNTFAFQLANAWCPATCGCDRPDHLPTQKIAYGCPGQCPFSPIYRDIIAKAPCEDTHPGSPTWPSWVRITDHYKKFRTAQGDSSFTDLLIQLMLSQHCGIVKYFAWMCDDAENLNAAYVHFANLRYWCPVTCQCNSRYEADCPSACNGTMSLPRSGVGVSTMPQLKPGLPDRPIARTFASIR
jgi:hypothetical protein